MEGAGHADPSRRRSQSRCWLCWASYWQSRWHTVPVRGSSPCDWRSRLLGLQSLTKTTSGNACCPVKVRVAPWTLGDCAGRRRTRRTATMTTMTTGRDQDDKLLLRRRTGWRAFASGCRVTGGRGHGGECAIISARCLCLSSGNRGRRCVIKQASFFFLNRSLPGQGTIRRGFRCASILHGCVGQAEVKPKKENVTEASTASDREPAAQSPKPTTLPRARDQRRKKNSAVNSPVGTRRGTQ